MKNNKHFHIVSLGCPKNRVDSERILAVMTGGGFPHTPDPEKAAVIIVNTCAFIEPAVEESIDAILDSHAQNEHAILVVAGCLPLRYPESLGEPLPEVALFVGPEDIPRLPRLLESLYCSPATAHSPHRLTPAAGDKKQDLLSREGSERDTDCSTANRGQRSPRSLESKPRTASHGTQTFETARVLTTPGYAYLKIAEGCSRRCRFCTIPSIRGPLKSVDIPALERETRALAARGVRELVLVAQDLTSYGLDRTKRRQLIKLLERISLIDGIVWIRLMYLHPDGIPSGLSDMINGSSKILPYLDIPFQHVSETVLRSMGRPWKGDRVRRLVDRLRREVNGLVLRTSLMVGYPTEGDAEFDELKQFTESSAIDHVGVFTYYSEEGTVAAGLGDPVPREVKEQRAQEIIAVHSRLLEKRNRSKIGSLQQCLVEGVSEETDLLLKARTWDQAPEVDGSLHITAGNAVAGEIHTARITGFHGPDLFGELVETASRAKSQH